MFSKLLIANRGEIAVRVIRACRELGISSVAVYSDLDRDALHVRLADEAYALGGSTASESYLRIAAILSVAERSGCEAVHPGYGFLSENADFAQAVTDSGIVFVGPPPEAIEVMGDKLSARSAAAAVGVSGVPGTTEPIIDPDEVADFGTAHGWPVAVKAAYGGGGRGLKVVTGPQQVSAAVDSARREALSSFGRDELYVERYFDAARHVEVQVLADTHGNCIHLGTRDCTAQRRHQKLIEEAPAPHIDPSMLAEMGEAAIRVAQGCGYVNAGTIEFLYAENSFHYLEMNTRLQVEHPVTEMITGIDLVEQQLRVASGEALPFGQEEIVTKGHAIEVRVNAEDPTGGTFMPCPGPITGLRPAQGFGTRWDGGYEAGDTVSAYYDNLIGKLVVWGRDRKSAIARSLRALDEMRLTGVATTIPAAQAILSHQDFAAVTHSTRWVEESLDLRGLASGTDTDAPPVPSDGVARVRRELDVEVDGRRFNVALWTADTDPTDPAESAGDRTTRALSGSVPRRKRGLPSAGSGTGEVTVPMQGTIVKILAEVGDTVEAGDPIVVLEAMKMENNIVADRAGKISEIRVTVGDSVGGGDTVAVIT